MDVAVFGNLEFISHRREEEDPRIMRGQFHRRRTPAVREGATVIKNYLMGLPPDSIVAFTDGSSLGNPGPAGIGVVLCLPPFAGHQPLWSHEIARGIGVATNNIAELKAIETAIQTIHVYLDNVSHGESRLLLRIMTDSTYAIGVIHKNWSPTKNRDLIEQIRIQWRRLQSRIPDSDFKHVRGHATIPGNERADSLATQSARTQKNRPATSISGDRP